MSVQRSLFAVALLLGMAVGAATPASAQRGIWVKISLNNTWTLTVINLTEYPLSLVTNDVTASKAQRPPFHNTLTDEADFPVPPYQNLTWKSNTATLAYPHARWNGTLHLLAGNDAKWMTSIHFVEHWYQICNAETGCSDQVGTWVYLTGDLSNAGWVDDAAYNISCSYPDYYNTTYNVMTLSGTDFVASLYAPYVDEIGAPSADITMVIRQRYAHTQLTNGYQDSLVAPCLTFQENNGYW